MVTLAFRGDACNVTGRAGPPFSTYASTPPAACDSYTSTYHPSAWEAWWVKNIADVAEATWEWKQGCEAMKCMEGAAAEWMHQWARSNKHPHSVVAHAAWPDAVFSHFEVLCLPSREVVARTAIEPLVGTLRHPLDHCLERCPPCHHGGSKDFIFPLVAKQVYPPLGQAVGGARDTAAPCAYLFDLGASLYRSGLGGSSQDWFVDNYARRGIRFHRILSWEPTAHSGTEVVAGMPPEVYDITSYFNVGVSGEPSDKLNPLRTLRAITRPSDLVVLKIDIDAPAIEHKLFEQLLDDPSLHQRVDELYYEDHVRLHPFMHGGPWARHLDEALWKGMNRTIMDSIAMFHQLRRLGVRAHSWV